MFKGSKIYLRALEESDISSLHKWNFDPEVTSFFSPRWPNSYTEQKKWFDSQFSGNKKKLIIVDIESNLPIGLVGIMEIDHVNKNCEIGITIGENKFLGKGYAKEAMKLALKFLFTQLNIHCVYLKVFENNNGAIGLFEKCGFKKDGIMRDMVFRDNRYISYVVMSIIKDEFLNE